MQSNPQKKPAANTSREGLVGAMNPLAKGWLMFYIIVLSIWNNSMQWGWWEPSWGDTPSAILWTFFALGTLLSLGVLNNFTGNTRGNYN